MKSAVIVFPGINRERDMARALKLVSGREPAMVWHADHELPAGTDLVVIPGGFSYGDYLRCGAIAARAPIMDAVRAFAAKGGLVLAICNGFQIACEAGLLPGVLMRNTQLRFICREVYLRVERSDTPFTSGYNVGQVICVPVAHGEGNYIADGKTIARLEGEGRVLFRYSSPDGIIDPNWNHNGAMNGIAGIINERGNVLGMMPHPENHVEAAMGKTDGRGLFAGLERATPRARTNFAEPFRHFQNSLHRRGIAIVISDLYETPETIVRSIAPLRFHGNEVILFHVLDPQEINPIMKGPSILVDLETDQKLEVIPDYAKTTYRTKINAHIDKLR